MDDGVTTDTVLSFDSHVSNLAKIACDHLRHTTKIRNML